MGEKKPALPAKGEPKPAVPPAGGLSLPPARGGGAEAPASGLGMAKLPKVEPAGFAAPAGADENPFALPVARNLGPKPGESLFAPPPAPPEAKLPEAKPKPAAEPEPKLPEAKPKPVPEPEREPEEEEVEEEAPPPRKEPPPKEAPRQAEASKEPPAAAEEDDSAALFLPSSTKEIVVEPAAKRAKPEAREPERAAAAGRAPAADGAAKPKAGRPSAVYLAALAGGALGLFSVGAVFMMLRSEPPVASRPTGSSPFGKRAAGDATMTPVLDDAAPDSADARGADRPFLPPAPASSSDLPPPTSLPSPALSRPVEPPSPGGPGPAVAEPPKAPPPAPAPAPPPVSAPSPVPAVVEAPKPPPPANPPRATATFPQITRPKPAAPPVADSKPKAAPAPKKPSGPQWVFEGTVYDLISTRGAYGVRLLFVDAEDNEVASVETAEDGRYRVTMKAGPPEGYSLRILHDDYSGKHIDELDSTSSVRKADLEQRKFLMQAGARSLPWIGAVGKPVRRDMALVPKIAPE